MHSFTLVAYDFIRHSNNYITLQIKYLILFVISNKNLFENGQKIITVDRLIKLAKFYNVSTDYILGLTDSKNKEW